MKLSYRCTCEREFKRDKYSGISNLDGRSKGAKNIKKNHCIICFVRNYEIIKSYNEMLRDEEERFRKPGAIRKSLEWRFLKMPGVKCRMLLGNFV